MLGTYLIVGLGNPGKEYEYTRHNLGFMVVRHLAKEFNWEFQTTRLAKGLIAKGEVRDSEVHLLLPLTFMNNSGLAVKPLVEKKNLTLENLLVICDDLNLSFGHLRLRSGGSDGGHHGLSSITECLNTKYFSRLRMGIGEPSSREQAVDYVLGEFNAAEKKSLDGFVADAADCCLIWLKEGINKAMQLYNK